MTVFAFCSCVAGDHEELEVEALLVFGYRLATAIMERDIYLLHEGAKFLSRSVLLPDGFVLDLAISYDFHALENCVVTGDLQLLLGTQLVQREREVLV